MSSPPSAILFINGDISYPSPPIPPLPTPSFVGELPQDFIGPSGGLDPNSSTLTTLQIQLFINDTITQNEYLARLSVDPNYSTIIRLQGLRVLVIVPSYHDFEFRQFEDGYADIFLFFHQGLIDVLKNRFGPCQSFPADRITIYQLLHAVRENRGECFLPFNFPSLGGCCDDCGSRFFCDVCHDFSGQKIHRCGCDCKCLCGFPSLIHLPNCDRELNNRAFIHRK